MLFEEPENKYDRLFEKSDKYEKIAKKFMPDFGSEVCQVIKAHRPLIEENIDEYILKVYSIIKDATTTAMEILFLCMSGNVGNCISKIPKELCKEEEEVVLKQRFEKLNIPEDGVAEFNEIFWDIYENQLKIQEYTLAVFNKMKEVLVKYYYNDIIDLEGNALRKLNSDLYHNAALGLIEEIYGLEKEIRTKSDK